MIIVCVNILIELGLCQFYQLETGPYALWILIILVKKCHFKTNNAISQLIGGFRDVGSFSTLIRDPPIFRNQCETCEGISLCVCGTDAILFNTTKGDELYKRYTIVEARFNPKRRYVIRNITHILYNIIRILLVPRVLCILKISAGYQHEIICCNNTCFYKRFRP